MWIAERGRGRGDPEGSALVGRVTLAGDPAGVYLDGERRGLPVYGPGGYLWRPARGQEVLVLKTGRAGEQPCVAGARGQPGWNLNPGEVYLYSSGASIHLRSDGVISMQGLVLVNGLPVAVEEG